MRETMKPLLIAAVGRTISSVPLGRRDDDVEVRRVPALPAVSSLDCRRPTVIVLDRALVASAGGEASACAISRTAPRWLRSASRARLSRRKRFRSTC